MARFALVLQTTILQRKTEELSKLKVHMWCVMLYVFVWVQGHNHQQIEIIFFYTKLQAYARWIQMFHMNTDHKIFSLRMQFW